MKSSPLYPNDRLYETYLLHYRISKGVSTEDDSVTGFVILAAFSLEKCASYFQKLSKILNKNMVILTGFVYIYNKRF